jgi:hypothetical protein
LTEQECTCLIIPSVCKYEPLPDTNRRSGDR